MRRIESIEELKKIQLDLLLVFHRFCVEHDIKYSLAAGTLIGAVRHKGFIPWDDDIDVYLLRDEYKKLIEVYPRKSINNCSLVSMERDNNWHRAYAKFYDSRTLMMEKTKSRYEGIGVGIDVFPVDDVPDNQEEWKRYNKRRIFLRNIMSVKTMAFSAKRNILKTAFLLVGQFLLLPVSQKALAKILDKYGQKYNGKGFRHVYENNPGVYNSKHAWLKKDMEQFLDSEFEGYQVKIMAGYDDYLTTIYGNYMQLPPEEKRVSHHTFVAFRKV